MLPKTREALTKAIEKKMEETGLNWNTIQTAKIATTWRNEKNDPLNFGWVTIRRIVKDMDYNLLLIKQKRLLDWFGILNVTKYGVITVVNLEEHETDV